MSQGCIVRVAALELAGKHALPETDCRSSRDRPPSAVVGSKVGRDGSARVTGESEPGAIWVVACRGMAAAAPAAGGSVAVERRTGVSFDSCVYLTDVASLRLLCEE